jgi:hypothetical protein
VARDRRAGASSSARSGAAIVVEIARAFVFRPSLHALRVRCVVLIVGVMATLKKKKMKQKGSEVSM